jgi:16S rRNA (guanine966-N2)-methyltransferase
MRVVAGRAKGHRLQAPRGAETRPTSDKVREAIFGMLGDVLVDRSVLDLFAGTGALGIEALSRGAAHADFVERRAPACAVIRANLRHTKLEDQARVLCMPVERALSILDPPYGLILLDPPYAYPGLSGIMNTLGGARVVASDTIVVFEHSPRFAVDERYQRLVLRRQKVYGDTAVSIFGTQEGQDA